MEQFDRAVKEIAEKEEMIVPGGFDERVQSALNDLPPRQKKHKLGAVKVALIAAAACLLLVGTVFATNEITGGLVFNDIGWIVLGRFEWGHLVDGNGEEVDPAQLDGAQLESGEYTVRRPSHIGGVQLAEEDGRVILYGQCSLIEVRLDITDELLENGAFHYYEAREGNYWLSLMVYSVALEEHTQDNPLVYEGVAYLADASGMVPNDRGGVFEFAVHDARCGAVNSG